MRKTMTSLAALYLAACLTLPAGALSYTIDAPGNPDYQHPHRAADHR